MEKTRTASLAELLSDTAVYARTSRGQRELLNVGDPASSTTTTRVLARVNGHTDLRSLVDLAPGEAGAIAQAVVQLVRRGFIELVDGSQPGGVRAPWWGEPRKLQA